VIDKRIEIVLSEELRDESFQNYILLLRKGSRHKHNTTAYFWENAVPPSECLRFQMKFRRGSLSVFLFFGKSLKPSF
jgi:hypothetical protein